MNEPIRRTCKQLIGMKVRKHRFAGRFAPCREVFAQSEDFVKKITGISNMHRPCHPLSVSTRERTRCRSGILASRLILKFSNRPNLQVVVTVDMLATSMHIPVLEWIGSKFNESAKKHLLKIEFPHKVPRSNSEMNPI